MKKSNENGLLDPSDNGMDRSVNGMDRNGMDQSRRLAPQTPGQPALSAVSGNTKPMTGKRAEGASVGSLSFEQTMKESCQKLSNVIECCREATIRGVGALPEDEQKALKEAFDEALSKASEVFTKEMEVMLREYKKKAECYDYIITCVREEEGVNNVAELLDKIDGERASWDRKSREWERERAQWHRLEHEMQLRENETPLSRWQSINAEIQKLHGRLDNMSGYEMDFNDKKCGDMDGRWMNRLPAMSKYNGKKEDWDDFENGFMIRYGQLNTPVALSLLRDLVCDKAKDALRGVPQSTKTSGLKAVMTWLRKKLSDETVFDRFECELKLTRQTIGNKTVGEVTEELEKITAKMYAKSDVLEQVRRNRLLVLYMEREHAHERLMTMYGEEKSYEAMKGALIEMEIIMKNSKESSRWYNGNDAEWSQINHDDDGDHGHRDEENPTDNENKDNWNQAGVRMVLLGDGVHGEEVEGQEDPNKPKPSRSLIRNQAVERQDPRESSELNKPRVYTIPQRGCEVEGHRDLHTSEVSRRSDSRDHEVESSPDLLKTTGAFGGSKFRDTAVERHDPRGSSELNKLRMSTTHKKGCQGEGRERLKDQGQCVKQAVERHDPRGSSELNRPRPEGCEGEGREVPKDPMDCMKHVIESQKMLKKSTTSSDGIVKRGGTRKKAKDDAVFIKRVRPASAIINGLQVEACLDTGSDVNLIDERRLDQMRGVSVRHLDKLAISDFRGERVPLCGKVVLDVELEIGRRSKVGFYVTVMDLPMIVLGNAALKAMGLALCVQGDSNGQPASDYKDEPRPADLARTLVEERRGM